MNGVPRSRYTRGVTGQATGSDLGASSGAVAGMLALQLVDHWGNRHTPRPRPRADVLAAAFLLGPARCGDLPTFAALAERCSRYTAYLVRRLAAPERSTEADARSWQRLLAACQHDPRYRDVVGSAVDAVNLSILTVTHALAAHLSADGGDGVFPGLPQKESPSPLRVLRIGERTYRLRPWPLAGCRLTLHAESPADKVTAAAGDGAAATLPLRHRAWTLLAPGAPAD